MAVMRIVIVVMLLAVVYNMGRALIFIFRDQGHERERGVRALTLRVALSFALVVLLVVGNHLGWITPKF